MAGVNYNNIEEELGDNALDLEKSTWTSPVLQMATQNGPYNPFLHKKSSESFLQRALTFNNFQTKAKLNAAKSLLENNLSDKDEDYMISEDDSEEDIARKIENLKKREDLLGDAYNQAWEDTYGELEEETDPLGNKYMKYKHPEDVYNRLMDIAEWIGMTQAENYKKKYHSPDKQKAVAKYFENYTDDEDDSNAFLDEYKSEVIQDLINAGALSNTASDRELIESAWSNPEYRKGYVVEMLGYKYLTGDALEEFKLSDDIQRERILANEFLSDPNYTSSYLKLHDQKEQFRRDAFGGFGDKIDKYADYCLNEATSSFGEGYYGVEKLWNTTRSLGGISLWGLSQLGSILYTGATKGLTYTSEVLNGSWDKQEADARLRRLKDEYIEQKSQLILEGLTEEMALDAVSKWDELSRLTSNIFLLEEGSHIVSMGGTKEESDANKIHQYCKYLAEKEINGEQAASLFVNDFYKDLSSKNMTKTEWLTRGAGQFATNFAADLVSTAAIVKNLGNPDAWENGYSDALMHDSWLQYASALQETGAWNEEDLQKYKTLGLNANQIYRSVEQENLFMSSADIPDLIGLYGFTAASTIVSLGASGAASALLKQGTGKIRSKLLRAAIKSGLSSDMAKLLNLTSKEILAAAKARSLYYGNLLSVGTMTGTAEGALEAVSTYNKFVEDNKGKLFNEKNGIFTLQLRALQNMSDLDLSSYIAQNKLQIEQYMIANEDKYPVRFSKNTEGNSFNRTFTEEEYKLAAKEILFNNYEVARLAAMDRVEDDALDAAAANLISNSFINGALNVTLKATLLDPKAQEAIRSYKGGKALTDYVNISKDTTGKWVASAKNIVSSTRNKGWKNAMSDIKKKTVSLAKESPTALKEAVKTGYGEAVEEWTQGISDGVMRAAFEADLDQYVNTVINGNVQEALGTDISNIVKAGLQALGSEVTNTEHYKEALFGFLSSGMGGVSPTGAIRNLVNAGADIVRGDKKSFNTYKNAFKDAFNLKNLVEGGIVNSYKLLLEEAKTGEAFAETINTWLNREGNQQMMEHLGGAIGFQQAVMEGNLTGDMFSQQTDKLGLAIENILMMEALHDTDMYQEYMTKLSNIVDLKTNDLFDQNGKFVGDNLDIVHLIDSFKNLDKNTTRSSLLTDKLIFDKVLSNAREYLEMRLNVLETTDRIHKIFKVNGSEEANMDPLVTNALTYAVMSSKNAKERHDKLAEKLSKVVLRDGGQSNLSKLATSHLANYHSLHGILNRIKELTSAIAVGNATHTMSYRQKHALNQEIKQLRQTEKELQERKEQLASPDSTISLTTESFDVLSALDIFNLNALDKQALLTAYKENKLSLAQQIEVKSFLLQAKELLLGDDAINRDYNLTEDEVLLDYVDMSILDTKSLAYDRFLDEYIKNPQWLSSLAELRRKENRTKVLKDLYKDYITIKPTENILDFIDKVNTKIAELRANDKLEDASILEKLKLQNPEYLKFRNASILSNQALTIYSSRNKDLEPQELLIIDNAIKTLLLTGNLSYEELKSLLLKSDITQFRKLLLTLHSSGKTLFNHLLEINNLPEFEYTEDNLKDIRQKINNVLKGGSKKATAKLLENKPITTTPRTSGVVASESPEDNSTPEAPIIKITSPGDPNLNQASSIAQLLKRLGANSGVNKMRSTHKIHYLVTSKGVDSPVILAAIALNAKDPSDNTSIKIGSLYYRVVGFVDSSQSAKLNEAALKALATGSQDIVLIPGISSSVNSIGNAVSLSSNLAETMNSMSDYIAETEWDNLASGLIQEGKIESEGQNKEIINLKYFGLQVKKGIDSFLDLVINKGTLLQELSTVRSILLRLDITDDQKILLLKRNKMFEEFFNSWLNFSPINPSGHPKDSMRIYKELIGDFFYLGRTSESSTSFSVDPKVDNTTLSIAHQGMDQYTHARTYTELQIPSVANSDNQLLALLALLQLMTDIDAGSFRYSNPQMDLAMWNNSAVFKKLHNIVLGLIQSGCLQSYPVTSIRRDLVVSNPFSNVPNKPLPNLRAGATPLPGAQVSGGRVDPLTEQPIEGTPKGIRLRAEDVFNKLHLDIKDTITRLRKLSNVVKDPNTVDADFYDVNGSQHARTTSVEDAIINRNASKFDDSRVSEDAKVMSQALGNTIDTLIRDFFDICNGLLASNIQITDKNVIEELKKNPAFNNNGNLQIPNLNAYYAQLLIQRLVIVQRILLLEGMIIIPKDVRVKGSIPVKLNGVDKGFLRVAGTLDLLAYNQNTGKFHIIDIKTIHRNSSSKQEQIETKFENSSRADNWSALVSTYQELCSLEEPDMQFGLNYVLPIFLDYTTIASPEVASDRMTIQGYLMQKVPELYTDKKGTALDPITLEDVFYPVETVKPEGYDYDKLSENDKARIDTSNLPKVQAPAPTPRRISRPSRQRANRITADIAGQSALDAFGSMSDDPQSRKTTKEAKFVDFINNRIAPLSTLKVSVVSRIKNAFTKLLMQDKINMLVNADLAKTLFNGNIQKLQEITGLKLIDTTNIKEAINKLNTYFKGYIALKETYLLTVLLRYTISKALYLYLSNEISELQLSEILSEYELAPSNIAELIEFAESDNKEKTRLEILDRFNKLGIHTEEHFTMEKEAIEEQLADMEVKQLLLSDPNCENMLLARISSVKDAIVKGQYLYKVVSKNGSVEDLLNAKEGLYSAYQVLEDLIGKSPTRYGKLLSASILKYLRANHINATISINLNSNTNDIEEGSFDGTNILLNKSALTSAERLERVLLHELLHVVALNNPQIKEVLTPLYELALLLLSTKLDMTVQEAKDSIYGFKNIDEFISEYFTNALFLQLLKSLEDVNTKYDTIFDTILNKIKSLFIKNPSIYDRIDSTMQSIFNVSNSISRDKEATLILEITPYSLTSDAEKEYIKHLGITEKEYNKMSLLEIDTIKNCCK